MLKRSTLILSAFLMLAVCLAHAAETVSTIESKYPRLSYGPLSNAVPTVLPSGTLLSADGITITSKALSADIATKEKSGAKNLKNYSFYALEMMAVEKLITKEAADWAKENKIDKPGTGDALINKYLDSKVAGINASDEEAKQFYDANKSMIGDASFDEVKEDIKDFLGEEKKQNEVTRLITSIGTRHKIQVSDTWAAAQYKQWIVSPVEKIRRSGKASMVTFGATWCGPCKQMEPIRAELAKKYKGKMNFLHLDANKEPVLAEYYGADSIPLILFYDTKGEQTFRQVGFMDKASLEKEIAKLGVK